MFGVTYIDGDLSIIQEQTEEKNLTFLHERIHYIQNFSTLYGLNHALLNMSQYLGRILQIQQGRFPTIPYDREDQEFIGALYDMAEGDSFDIGGEVYQCSAIHAIEEVDNYKFFGYDTRFPELYHLYKCQLILKYDDEKEFAFGGCAISESMAYLFEQVFYDKAEYSHALPYDACRLIYKFIMNRECDNPVVMIALCYASLMTMWPGNTFIDLVKQIKNDDIELGSAKAAFEFARNKMQIIDSKLVDDIRIKLDLIFPEEKEFPIRVWEDESRYARDWLKTKYKVLAENEEEYREKLICVLDEIDVNKRIEMMANLLDEYGQPIVVDAKGKIYTGEDKSLVYTLAPLSLYKVVTENEQSCFMYEICVGNNGTPSENCRKCCWKHNSGNSYCILRYYLYKMGLGATQFETLEKTPFDACCCGN